MPAAWMIERSGWKGKSVGGAAVHDNQALVIINKDHASAQDIIELASEIVRSVKEKFNIGISPEVNFI